MFSRDLIIDRIELLKGQMGQKELAEIIGCTQSKISGLLSRRGTKNFTVEELCSLADYFHVSVDYLLGRDDIKDRRSGSEEAITPRKLCKVLADTLESSFPWSLAYIEVDDPDFSDPSEERTKKVKYPVIYFDIYNGFNQLLSDVPDYVPFDCNDYENQLSLEINHFLVSAARINRIKELRTITHEDFEDLMDKKVSKIINEPLL